MLELAASKFYYSEQVWTMKLYENKATSILQSDVVPVDSRRCLFLMTDAWRFLETCFIDYLQ